MRRAVVLLLAAGALCAQSTTIHGVVKDEATGHPVPNLPIQLVPARASHSTTTDDTGRYLFPNVTAGTIVVNAGPVERPELTRIVHVKEGEDLTVDFLMPPKPTISGRVLTPQKEPDPHALVWLIQSQYESGVLRRNPIGPMITRDDGTFAFDQNLEPGRAYYVLADRPAPKDRTADPPLPIEERDPIDTPTYYGDVTAFEAATPITLRPGEHREKVEIKIRQTASYCVDGKIDSSGPLALHWIAIRERAIASTGLARARLDPAKDGTFHTCGLPPGDYSLFTDVSQSPLDFVVTNTDVHKLRLSVDTASLRYQLAWDGDPPADPAPPPPATATDPQAMGVALGALALSMVRPKGSYISLTVAPVGPSHVGSLRAESAPFAGLWSEALAAGDYRAVARVGGTSYTKEMTYDGLPIPGGVLRMLPGSAGTLRVVAAQGAGAISCKVLDPDGKPVPDSAVVIVPAGVTTQAQFAQLAQQSRTDISGALESASLKPGKYRVLALSRPYRPIPEDIDKLLLTLFQSQEVEVTANNTAQVILHQLGEL